MKNRFLRTLTLLLPYLFLSVHSVQSQNIVFFKDIATMGLNLNFNDYLLLPEPIIEIPSKNTTLSHQQFMTRDSSELITVTLLKSHSFTKSGQKSAQEGALSAKMENISPNHHGEKKLNNKELTTLNASFGFLVLNDNNLEYNGYDFNSALWFGNERGTVFLEYFTKENLVKKKFSPRKFFKYSSNFVRFIN